MKKEGKKTNHQFLDRTPPLFKRVKPSLSPFNCSNIGIKKTMSKGLYGFDLGKNTTINPSDKLKRPTNFMINLDVCYHE